MSRNLLIGELTYWKTYPSENILIGELTYRKTYLSENLFIGELTYRKTYLSENLPIEKLIGRRGLIFENLHTEKIGYLLESVTGNLGFGELAVGELPWQKATSFPPSDSSLSLQTVASDRYCTFNVTSSWDFSSQQFKFNLYGSML